MTSIIFNATPYVLGLPRVRYVSSHWWREDPAIHGEKVPKPTILDRIEWSLFTRGPLGITRELLIRLPEMPSAVLIDREGTDAETLAKVLEAFAELLPTCFRIVYDPELRVVYPHQAPKTDAVIGNRSVDPHEQRVGQLVHAFAADCYLMGIAGSGRGDDWNINVEKTLAELPAQLDLTRAASVAYESIIGKPVWPCVHERYHHGKGCGHNIVQTVEVWKQYNKLVGEKWPGPRVWWSGSMRRNPGNEADGWTLPSEHDMRQFAEVVR